MITALNSLDTSLSYFIQDKHGLGSAVIFTDENGTTYNIRKLDQSKVGDYKNRKLEDESMSNNQTFLIDLSIDIVTELPLTILPKRNNKITIDTEVWYVETWEKVSTRVFRVDCCSGVEKMPKPKRVIT